MPVIINQFEALAEGPASSAAPDQSGTNRDKRPEPIEPHDLMPALQLLTSRALRLWAH